MAAAPGAAGASPFVPLGQVESSATNVYAGCPPDGSGLNFPNSEVEPWLEVNPAELMGLELSHEERRSTIMVGQIINIMRANGDHLGESDIEKIVVAVMAAMKQREITAAKPPKLAAARVRVPRSG